MTVEIRFMITGRHHKYLYFGKKQWYNSLVGRSSPQRQACHARGSRDVVLGPTIPDWAPCGGPAWTRTHPTPCKTPTHPQSSRSWENSPAPLSRSGPAPLGRCPGCKVWWIWHQMGSWRQQRPRHLPCWPGRHSSHCLCGKAAKQ